MIDPVTGCFETTQYDDTRAISIAILFETTWLSRYSIPIEKRMNKDHNSLVMSSESL